MGFGIFIIILLLMWLIGRLGTTNEILIEIYRLLKEINKKDHK